MIPLLALVVLLGASPSASASPTKRADAKLDAALRDFIHVNGGPPGVSAVIDRGGKAKLHRAGVRSVRSRKPFRKSDHMRIASVAKAFSGAVALSLVDQGKLSLDSTIGEVLPGLPAAWSQVTLHQALHHTAGLPDYIKSSGFRDAFTANPRRYFSPLDLIGFVADKPLLFTPGSRYEYSDTDNIVVGLMAEAVTGRSYERLLRTLVFKRLGMRRTSLPDGFLMPRPYIHGYGIAPPQPPEDLSQALSASGAWASGGIVSTPGDLNRFIRAYGGGELFGDALRTQQFQFIPGGASQPPGPGENSAGLAIFRYRTSCGTVFGHTGSFPGYTQLAATSRSGRRSVTVSANEQLDVTIGPPAAFDALERLFVRGACAALARK